MKSNKHLSLDERIRIGILYQAKKSIRYIAKELDRSPSTISRELRRPNAGKIHMKLFTYTFIPLKNIYFNIYCVEKSVEYIEKIKTNVGNI